MLDDVPGMPGRTGRMTASVLTLLLLAANGMASPNAVAQAGAATMASQSSALPPTESAALIDRLDALFAAAFPPEQPGAAVRMQRGDEVLLRKGYGMADLELGVPIAPDMVFQLCSITKQFTAVAVLMLAAEGQIDLGAPLGRYLPDYPEPGAAVTIHQLLTHISGIPNYTDEPAFWKTACLDRNLDELIDTWKDKPLEFPPGADWRYSNSGYVLLGKLIEVVSGQSYARFMDEQVFEVLGLRSTTCGDSERIIPGRVRGYDRQGSDYRNTAYVSLTLAHAAGALLSNVDDLFVWTDALFGSDKLLLGTWRDRLLSPAVLGDGRQTSYACGFEVHTMAGHRMIAHGGGGGGFAVFLAHVPDANITVAVLSNNAGSNSAPQALAQQAIALMLDVPMGEGQGVNLSQAIEIRDESLLDALVGRYELTPGFVVEVRREGAALLVQPPGQPALRVYPQSESRWFPLEIEALVVFQGFADGQADALVISQNGREMPAKRVQ